MSYIPADCVLIIPYFPKKASNFGRFLKYFSYVFEAAVSLTEIAFCDIIREKKNHGEKNETPTRI